MVKGRRTRAGRGLSYHPAAPYLFVAPAVLFFLAVSYIPIVSTVYLSFHEWNVLSPDKPFVGLDNYTSLVHDRVFSIAVKNTFRYVLSMVGIGVPLSLLLAIGANALWKGLKYFVRMAFFIPLVASMVAVGLVWVWIYEPRYGLMNMILQFLGLPTFRWLTDRKMALTAIIITSIWKNVGYNMIIFLSGLQAIPSMYYEAAQIDGANKLQLFRHITLPMLAPTLLFVLITTMIGAFQVFTEVFVMTSRVGTTPGGPVHSTRTLVLHIYETGFTFLKMGRASAIATLFLATILLLSMVQMRLFKREINL